MGGTIGFIVGGIAGYGIGTGIVNGTFHMPGNIAFKGGLETGAGKDALKDIWDAGRQGRRLIRELERSQKDIVIRYRSHDNSTEPGDPNRTVNWDNDEYEVKSPTFKQWVSNEENWDNWEYRDSRPPFIGLVHELGHILDKLKGRNLSILDLTNEETSVKTENTFRKLWSKNNFQLQLRNGYNKFYFPK